MLGNKSFIVTKRGAGGHNAEAVKKFQQRFEVLYYDNAEELQQIVDLLEADVFYAIKAGENDGLLPLRVKNVVHVVFRNFDPHGDVYAYVSEWLAKDASQGKYPFVPHIVHLPEFTGDLKEELGIPTDATVFGRYGGEDTFDIKFAQQAVVDMARKRKDLYFIFMGTRLFGQSWWRKPPKNLIFLPTTTDMTRKTAFINTCDAMLHARISGETFGLSIAEFSIKNKPIVLFNNTAGDRAHIDVLGSKGIYYTNYKELISILNNFRPDNTHTWDCFSERFSPRPVMQKFQEVFLQ